MGPDGMSPDDVSPDDVSPDDAGPDHIGADGVEAPAPRLLDHPRDGVPPVVQHPDDLREAIAALGAGHGPLAVDAERASGHRYGQRAFLVQLRREGAGTVLIDPAALPELGGLGAALADAEWVLHAAGQDLPCLAEVGLRPTRLFDTELGSRLAGLPRVGLASVVEHFLGLTLAKEHSAVDWSARPLPEPWLRYAALDVEVLVDLRDAVAAELDRQGKLDWALQEFAAVAAADPPAPRVDPWRRTSGMHRLRTRRQVGALRELWTARDALAREQDVSPGRLVPDQSLIEAVLAQPRTPAALSALKTFTGRATRRHLPVWFEALERARTLPEEALPPLHLPADGPPPPRLWAERDPVAAARLARARGAVQRIATEHTVPVENLIAPDVVRRLAWEPPAALDAAVLDDALRAHGVRPWQVELVAADLLTALLG